MSDDLPSSDSGGGGDAIALDEVGASVSSYSCSAFSSENEEKGADQGFYSGDEGGDPPRS
jgi:hypothetical protein